MSSRRARLRRIGWPWPTVGQQGVTWAESAESLQKAVDKAAWEQAMQLARTPLGALKRRTLKSTTYAKAPPGAPASEYVVIVYSSDFTGKADAIETVTPARAADGSWKVSGYFIR